MSFEAMLTEDIEAQSRTNTGTDFHPVWDWDTEFIENGLIIELMERNKVYDEGGKIIADHKLYWKYTTNTSGVNYKYRIKWGSNLYSIYSIKNPNQRNHHFEMKLLKLPEGFEESGS